MQNEERGNRSGKKIRDFRVYQTIDDILYESPDMAGNEWLMHRKGTIEQIEDEDERAPPLADIVDMPDTEDTTVPKEEKSLIELLLQQKLEKIKRGGMDE